MDGDYLTFTVVRSICAKINAFVFRNSLLGFPPIKLKGKVSFILLSERVKCWNTVYSDWADMCEWAQPSLARLQWPHSGRKSRTHLPSLFLWSQLSVYRARRFLGLLTLLLAALLTGQEGGPACQAICSLAAFFGELICTALPGEELDHQCPLLHQAHVEVSQWKIHLLIATYFCLSHWRCAYL